MFSRKELDAEVKQRCRSAARALVQQLLADSGNIVVAVDERSGFGRSFVGVVAFFLSAPRHVVVSVREPVTLSRRAEVLRDAVVDVDVLTYWHIDGARVRFAAGVGRGRCCGRIS